MQNTPTQEPYTTDGEIEICEFSWRGNNNDNDDDNENSDDDTPKRAAFNREIEIHMYELSLGVFVNELVMPVCACVFCMFDCECICVFGVSMPCIY